MQKKLYLLIILCTISISAFSQWRGEELQLGVTFNRIYMPGPAMDRGANLWFFANAKFQNKFNLMVNFGGGTFRDALLVDVGTDGYRSTYTNWNFYVTYDLFNMEGLALEAGGGINNYLLSDRFGLWFGTKNRMSYHEIAALLRASYQLRDSNWGFDINYAPGLLMSGYNSNSRARMNQKVGFGIFYTLDLRK